jgi:hypothetical protein
MDVPTIYKAYVTVPPPFQAKSLDLEPFPLVLVAPLNQIVHESVCHARCLLKNF